MIDLKEGYNRQVFIDFLKEDFLPDFKGDVRSVIVPANSSIKEATLLGKSAELDLFVFEFTSDSVGDKRVTLTKDAFSILKGSSVYKALAIFKSNKSSDFRFSLMTSTPVVNEKGKFTTILSNPKRYSFFLGKNAKVVTPTKFLIYKGKVKDFEDLKERFSIEVVNREFYNEISTLFVELVGGQIGKGKSKRVFTSLLKLPNVKDSSQQAQEFAVRLIGRLIFCWFLREKHDDSIDSLMPKSLLSLDSIINNKDYYHSILEPIFFEILNKPYNNRKQEYLTGEYLQIPYLNGGLFSPHDDDYYSSNEIRQEANLKNIVIPDEWLKKLFAVLETYNFTIDENTGFDEELSIDPEMLGRIFENLLAEINPETGESARKSTGSYYTPREVVDYMIDESLLQYLKGNTEVSESTLRSLISYDLEDDFENPLSEREKIRVIEALERLKILDPACGSGAFPIGALQKIVFILQQVDPHGQLWFQAQIKNIPVELRRNLERENKEKNFDYIRKLGVIRANIYGIDIQSIATEISRLRCFLTLIVDQKVDDMKENRGIDPLPNLDFKFVTANALIGLPRQKENEVLSMFEDSTGIEELREIRDDYFGVKDAFEREQLKGKFKDVQKQMALKVFKNSFTGFADLTETLINWDPFKHGSSSWFDKEWMFGVKDGFDIIIANPPYGIQFDPKTKSLYEKLYDSFRRNNDIFTAFYDKGLELARKRGFLVYITPNTFLNGDYYSALRSNILDRAEIVAITDYKNASIFADPTVFVCVFICQVCENVKMPYSYFHRNLVSSGSFESHFVSIDSRSCKFKPANPIFSKIMAREDVNILDTLFFVKDVGFNYWTVGKGKKRDGNSIGDRILYSGNKQLENDIPFIKGRDLNKYHIADPSNYLRSNYAELLNKNDVFRYSEEFLKTIPKIVYRQTANTIIATLDEKGLFLDKTVHLIVPKPTVTIDLKYILGLLNSDLFSYLYSYISQEEEGRTFSQVKTTYIKQLPVVLNDLERQKVISSLVGQLLSSGSVSDERKNLDEELNRVVYELYGVNNEDRNAIESKLKKRVKDE